MKDGKFEGWSAIGRRRREENVRGREMDGDEVKWGEGEGGEGRAVVGKNAASETEERFGGASEMLLNLGFEVVNREVRGKS
jgi:hypothetical protein